MTKDDLNRTAKRIAEFAREELNDRHRGVMPAGAGVYAVFGNDCYSTDPRAQEEADCVMHHALSEGCLASSIQTDEDGVTWAVAVVCKKAMAKKLHAVACYIWKLESEKRAGMNQGKATRVPEEILT